MRIAIAGDHHGAAYKKELIRALTSEGHEELDLGPSSTDPVDYPDYVGAVGAAGGHTGVAAGTPGWPRAPAVTAALERLERASVGARIWKKDARLWSDTEAVRSSIANRLGWLEPPVTMLPNIGDLDAFAASVRQEGFTDIVLLGMGGSSLAAEVLVSTFPPPPGAPALTVLDTTDPGTIRNALGRLKLAHTLFLVSSKSGTTAEVLALYRFFRAELEKCADRPGAHFVAITDAGTPLARLATEGRFRRIFLMRRTSGAASRHSPTSASSPGRSSASTSRGCSTGPAPWRPPAGRPCLPPTIRLSGWEPCWAAWPPREGTRLRWCSPSRSARSAGGSGSS